MTYVARFLVFMIALGSLWLAQSVVYAQDTQKPFLEIINVDRTQAPTAQLSLVGSNLTDDLSTLPVKLWEGDQEQAITADRTTVVGVQLALVIDPHNILAPGTFGPIHQAEILAATLRLTQNNIITRNIDLLAVYSLKADGAVQIIQDWTKEPNRIFNSSVQNKPSEIGEGKPLTDLLVQVLDKFQAQEQSTRLARTVLLFSPGASPLDVAPVIAKANERAVYINVVEMAGANQQPSQTGLLQQLAQQTHGQYILFESAKNLDALWPRLSNLRTQRTLTYQSSSTAPAPLNVVLTMPDGSPVQANFNPPNATTENSNPTQATTSTLAAANVTTTVGTNNAPVAAALATTATVIANNAPVAAALATTATVAPTIAADSAALAAPTNANAPLVDSNRPDRVVIPGLGIAVPRGALQLALPILILLLAYFVYRDLRERRARAERNPNLNRRSSNRDSHLYTLNDPAEDLKPLVRNKARTDDYARQTDDELPVQSVDALANPRYAPREEEEEYDNDDATIRPRPAFGDDEATYRFSEQIEQPIIGSLVRVSGNPTLPNEVPVYGLSPARGAARQIHIGRHSKNNTVVINDKSISREHAVIVQKEGRLYLRDNASTAGTFLNGKRLQAGEELLLRHNDLVSLGEVVYEFHAKGEDEATVAGE